MEKLVPRLRFPGFEQIPTRYKIQDLLDNGMVVGHLDGNHGELYPKSDEFANEGIPYIAATDFSDGTVNFSSCKLLPIERARKFKKGIARDGDVLFAHNATVGPVALLKTNFDYVILSTTATYFRCDNSRLLNYYLNYCLQTDDFVKQYSRVMFQSTRSQVPITAQRKFALSLPNYTEQIKVATFLNVAVSKLTALKKKKSLLEQYKKGMTQKIFNQEIRFKDEGKDFGEWEEKKLGECLDYEQPTAYLVSSTDYNDIFATPVLTAGKTFILGYTDETDGIYNKDLPVIIFDDFTTATQFVDFPFKAKSSAMKILKAKEGANIKYIYEVMQGIEHEIGGHGRHWISVFSQMEIAFPTLKEQTKIANFLSAIDDKIHLVAVQIEKLEGWKKGLLNEMFV